MWNGQIIYFGINYISSSSTIQIALHSTQTWRIECTLPFVSTYKVKYG